MAINLIELYWGKRLHSTNNAVLKCHGFENVSRCSYIHDPHLSFQKTRPLKCVPFSQDVLNEPFEGCLSTLDLEKVSSGQFRPLLPNASDTPENPNAAYKVVAHDQEAREWDSYPELTSPIKANYPQSPWKILNRQFMQVFLVLYLLPLQLQKSFQAVICHH